MSHDSHGGHGEHSSTPAKKKSLGVSIGIWITILFLTAGMISTVKGCKSTKSIGTSTNAGSDQSITYGKRSLDVADLLKDRSSVTVVMQDGDTYNHGGETHYVYTSKKIRLISTSTGRSYEWSGWRTLGDIPTPEENEFQISTDGTVEVTFKK